MTRIDELIFYHGVEKINTLTKYPSILTYHALGDRGVLKEELNEGENFQGPVYVTEKIDGTNSRIVLDSSGDYLIGSRENFLTAKNDRIYNPASSIVDAVIPIAGKLSMMLRCDFDGLMVVYGESYGGNITAASKQYTNDRSVGFRIFDITLIAEESCRAILSMAPDRIASWREHGGQAFQTVAFVQDVANKYGIQTVPYLTVTEGVPTSRSETYAWLNQFAATQAGINNTGKAEGVVVRTFDRSLIRKIRFEDYERTKKRGGF